jgi:hypothetical protein
MVDTNAEGAAAYGRSLYGKKVKENALCFSVTSFPHRQS